MGSGPFQSRFDCSTARRVASRFRVGRARPARILANHRTSAPTAASPSSRQADAGRRKSRNAGRRLAGCSARPPACRRACRESGSIWTARCSMRRSLRGMRDRNSASRGGQRMMAALEGDTMKDSPALCHCRDALVSSPRLLPASSGSSHACQPLCWRNSGRFLLDSRRRDFPRPSAARAIGTRSVGFHRAAARTSRPAQTLRHERP